MKSATLLQHDVHNNVHTFVVSFARSIAKFSIVCSLELDPDILNFKVYKVSTIAKNIDLEGEYDVLSVLVNKDKSMVLKALKNGRNNRRNKII